MKETVNSILKKLIYLSISLVIITGVSVFGSMTISHLEEERCWQTLGDSAASISREITLRITDSENVLGLAANAIARGELMEDQQALAQYIRSITEVTVFERIDVVYPDKSVLLEDGSKTKIPTDIPFTDLALLGKHMSGRTPDLFDENKQVVNYFVPVKKEKETIAILVGVVSCEKLVDVFSTKIYKGKTHICIVDTNNGLFIMDDWHMQLEDISILRRHKLMEEYQDMDIAEEIMQGKEGVVAYVSAINGKDSYMCYMPVGVDDWELLVVVQEDVAFESLIQIKKMVTGITITVLLVLTSYYIHAIIVNAKILKTKKEVERKLMISDTLIECVRILSLHKDSETSVNELLKHIREFFDADRAYIFEIDFDRETVNNSYEDVKEGVSAELEILQNVPLSSVDSWIKEFGKSGMYVIRNLNDDVDKETNTYEILARQNIVSLVAIPLKEKDKIIGFLGIDNPRENMQNVSLISSLNYFLMDSIEKRKTQTLLERLSYEDALTGLFNRNKFSIVMDDFESGKRKAQSLGFAYFDLNGLKVANDKGGHKAGDLLIQNTAKCLQIAFGKDAYRIGGDEFTVILPDVAQEVFEQMTESVKSLLAEQHISVSVGISWKGADYDVSKQLFEADKEMYSDKRRHYMKNDRRKKEDNEE